MSNVYDFPIAQRRKERILKDEDFGVPEAPEVIEDDDDEGAGRSADLEAAAAERGDEEARDNGRNEPLVGRGAACNGERHGQRQRDDGDGEPGDEIAMEIGERIAFPKHGHELRHEKLRW